MFESSLAIRVNEGGRKKIYLLAANFVLLYEKTIRFGCLPNFAYHIQTNGFSLDVNH